MKPIWLVTLGSLWSVVAFAQAGLPPEPIGDPADLTTTLSTDQDIYATGDPVVVELRTCNYTSDEIRFYEACNFDHFEVLGSNDQILAASDHSNSACSGALRYRRLSPGACELDARRVWLQTSGPIFNPSVETGPQVPPGTYRFRWRSDPDSDQTLESNGFALVTALPVPALDDWAKIGVILLLGTIGGFTLGRLRDT